MSLLHRDDPSVGDDNDDDNDDDDGVLPPSLLGMLDVAAMTNHELFTEVIASVRRGMAAEVKKDKNRRMRRRRGNKDDDDGDGDGGDDGGRRGAVEAGGRGRGGDDDWRRVAISIATSAARGMEGYRVADDWTERCRSLLFHPDDDDDDDGGGGGGDDGCGGAQRRSSPVDGTSDFGEALESLPARECYRNRLANALDMLDSATNAAAVRDDDDDTDDDGARRRRPRVSVRRVAGLARCCALLLDEEGDDDDDDDGGIDRGLRDRVVYHLARSMPSSSSSLSWSSLGIGGGPLLPPDVLLAVQSPLLRRMMRRRDGHAPSSSSSSSSSDGGRKRRRDDPGRKEDDDDEEEAVDAEEDDADGRRGGDALSRLLEAARLARRGAVRARHGAVIYVPSSGEENEDGGGGGSSSGTTTTVVIGRGWNHDYILDSSASGGRKNKIVLHSEAHAVVDAICNHGEDECFERLFPRATIMIVELASDYAYDTCHPCPKCDPMLRAVGIPTVLHTTPHGRIKELDMRPANAALLSNENVYIPLNAACRERNIICKRLMQKCEPVIAKR